MTATQAKRTPPPRTPLVATGFADDDPRAVVALVLRAILDCSPVVEPPLSDMLEALER